MDPESEKEFEKKIENKIKSKVKSWTDNCGHRKKKKGRHISPGTASCFYFLGFIGAAIYYIGQAETFWAGVLGFLQALVWPAFVVYHLLETLY